MCFHIKSDGWQCFLFISSLRLLRATVIRSSPASLHNELLLGAAAIIWTCQSNLVKARSKIKGFFFTESYYLSFQEDSYISANFSSFFQDEQTRELICGWCPPKWKMEAWQFIWGQTWERFSVYCMHMSVGVFIFKCVLIQCPHGLSDTVMGACGMFSRCTVLGVGGGGGGVLTRLQLCQICPNQTRAAEKMLAAHRGLSNQRKRERGKTKVDANPT